MEIKVLEYSIKDVAELLKKYNDIPNPIFNSDKYIYMKDGDELIAYGEIKKLNWYISELRHLFVIPKYRGKGYGRMILRVQMENANTPILVMTIREDNKIMRRIANVEGFNKHCIFKSKISNKNVVLYIKGGE